MEARVLIGNAAHDPETLRAAFQAFDSAWNKIAPNYGNDPKASDGARVQLAKIILSIIDEQGSNAEHIRDLALEIFAGSQKQL